MKGFLSGLENGINYVLDLVDFNNYGQRRTFIEKRILEGTQNFSGLISQNAYVKVATKKIDAQIAKKNNRFLNTAKDQVIEFAQEMKIAFSRLLSVPLAFIPFNGLDDKQIENTRQTIKNHPVFASVFGFLSFNFMTNYLISTYNFLKLTLYMVVAVKIKDGLLFGYEWLNQRFNKPKTNSSVDDAAIVTKEKEIKIENGPEKNNQTVKEDTTENAIGNTINTENHSNTLSNTTNAQTSSLEKSGSYEILSQEDCEDGNTAAAVEQNSSPDEQGSGDESKADSQMTVRKRTVKKVI